MHCENCGNKIKEDDKFCVKCGSKVEVKTILSPKSYKELGVGIWFRLAKVAYIFCYFLLLVIVYFVFTESSETWNSGGYYGNSYYTYDYWTGFWTAFWTYLGGSAFLKLIKVSAFYVAKGLSPDWPIEIKKVFNPFY